MAMPIQMPVHLALNVPPWGQGASLDHVAAAALAALATGIALQLQGAAPVLAGATPGHARADGEAIRLPMPEMDLPGMEPLGRDHAPSAFTGPGRGSEAARGPAKLTDIWGMKDFVWLT